MQRKKNLRAIARVGIVLGLASASWAFEPGLLKGAPSSCLQQPQSLECRQPPLPSAGFSLEEAEQAFRGETAREPTFKELEGRWKLMGSANRHGEGFRVVQLQINLVAPNADVVWGFLSKSRIKKECEKYAQALYHETVSQQPKLANECTEMAVGKRRFDIYQNVLSGSSKFTESYWDGYCHVGVFCLMKDPAGIDPDSLCQATQDNYAEAKKLAFAEYNKPNHTGWAEMEYEEKCQISLGSQIRAGNL